VLPFGQNASVQAFRKPPAVIQTCAFARPYGGERECIRYAAMDIAGTYSGGEQASGLCNEASSGLRGTCYEAIGQMLRYLRNTEAARSTACRSITADLQYVAQCIAGSSLQASIPGLAR
jgi:hypothetical protein